MENKYRSFDELPLTLRVEDLMPILGIGRNTAYELVRSGQIKGLRIGKQIRIPKEEVKRFLSESDLSLIHISEPTRQAEISYAVFCLKKKKKIHKHK